MQAWLQDPSSGVTVWRQSVGMGQVPRPSRPDGRGPGCRRAVSVRSGLGCSHIGSGTCPPPARPYRPGRLRAWRPRRRRASSRASRSNSIRSCTVSPRRRVVPAHRLGLVHLQGGVDRVLCQDVGLDLPVQQIDAQQLDEGLSCRPVAQTSCVDHSVDSLILPMHSLAEPDESTLMAARPAPCSSCPASVPGSTTSSTMGSLICVPSRPSSPPTSPPSVAMLTKVRIWAV